MKIAAHEDRELEELLGGEILMREKLHHWPLSYVEKVTMKRGETVVYKAQHAAASSMHRLGRHSSWSRCSWRLGTAGHALYRLPVPEALDRGFPAKGCRRLAPDAARAGRSAGLFRPLLSGKAGQADGGCLQSPAIGAGQGDCLPAPLGRGEGAEVL